MIWLLYVSASGKLLSEAKQDGRHRWETALRSAQLTGMFQVHIVNKTNFVNLTIIYLSFSQNYNIFNADAVLPNACGLLLNSSMARAGSFPELCDSPVDVADVTLPVLLQTAIREMTQPGYHTHKLSW